MALVTQAITLARDLDDLRMVQEPVEDRRGAGHVADQLAPIQERAVRVMMVERVSCQEIRLRSGRISPQTRHV